MASNPESNTPEPDFRQLEGLAYDAEAQSQRHNANYGVARGIMGYGAGIVFSGLAVFGIHGVTEGFETPPETMLKLEAVGAVMAAGGFAVSSYQKRAAESQKVLAKSYQKQSRRSRMYVEIDARNQLIDGFPEKNFKSYQVYNILDRVLEHPAFNPAEPNTVEVFKIIEDKKKANRQQK